MRRSALASLLIAGVLAPTAWATNAAQRTGGDAHPAHGNAGARNANAPINVSSDNFVGNSQTKIGTYSGNVIITQADDKLHADKVTVVVVAGKPSRFQANGHVVF